MTQSERAKRVVDRMMHKAHEQYQRQQLSKDKLPSDARSACPEVRGCRFENRKPVVFRPEWFTHLRPNFWRGFFETMIACQK